MALTDGISARLWIIIGVWNVTFYPLTAQESRTLSNLLRELSLLPRRVKRNIFVNQSETSSLSYHNPSLIFPLSHLGTI